MNDTHPAIAVAELMRLLVDEHGMLWGKAWGDHHSRRLNYTNHTLLPEALEAWPLALMNDLLPRHMQIMFLINHKHLKRVPEAMKGDVCQAGLRSRSSRKATQKRVRMGHLAFIGSRRVNGVSALHTDLMKQTIFADLERRSIPGASSTRPTASPSAAG